MEYYDNTIKSKASYSEQFAELLAVDTSDNHAMDMEGSSLILTLPKQYEEDFTDLSWSAEALIENDKKFSPSRDRAKRLSNSKKKQYKKFLSNGYYRTKIYELVGNLLG